MVLDKENDKIHPRYLAYDIIVFQVSFFFHESDLLVQFITLGAERVLRYFLTVHLLTLKSNLLFSWHFSRYSAPIHWLVHGHMTSNNETVSCQMPWTGNIAKTSNDVKWETVRCYPRNVVVAHDQRWPDVVAGISARFSKFAFQTSSRETLRFLGNKIHCSPRDQSLSDKCCYC